MPLVASCKKNLYVIKISYSVLQLHKFHHSLIPPCQAKSQPSVLNTTRSFIVKTIALPINIRLREKCMQVQNTLAYSYKKVL
jgi:hypothetical protein